MCACEKNANLLKKYCKATKENGASQIIARTFRAIAFNYYQYVLTKYFAVKVCVIIRAIKFIALLPSDDDDAIMR